MALEEHGLEVDQQLIVLGDFRYESGYKATEYLANLAEPPTAIVSLSDEMSIGAINYYQDHGHSIPEDVEVVSFDNTRLTTMVRPQLTSVVQPMYDIGAVSMRLLTKYMNKEKVEDHLVILPHRIEERHSTRSVES